MFTIQQLRFLVAVVDHGGVNKAAERLHISQPSISAGIKMLEQSLGLSLLERSQGSRHLSLTPAGQRFYRDAVDILGRCEAAHAGVAGEMSVKRKVRIGVLDTLSRALIMKVVQEVAGRDAGLKVEWWEGANTKLAGWFAQGRVDMLWGNIDGLASTARIMRREPLLAVAAPNHPLAAVEGRITMRDLGAYHFVHRSRCELDPVGRIKLRAGAIKLDVRVRAEREELAFEFVRSGGFITLAPASLIPDDLLGLSVTGLDVERNIGLQWQEFIEPEILALVTDSVETAMRGEDIQRLA